MAKGYLLSPADHKILKQMIYWFRKQKRRGGAVHQEYAVGPAPETYVAQVPGEGISGRVGVEPGSAECDLCRIDPDGEISAIGISKIVYNLSTDFIGEETGTGTTDMYVPVTRTKGGQWIVFSGDTGGSKMLCRFTLSEELTTSDEYASATITHQYGPGADHSNTSITVYNLLTSDAGVYVFEGDSGDAGLAIFDSDTNWKIIQLECP